MVNQILERKPKNIRELRPYLKTVDKINELESKFASLSDEELKQKTTEFKERLSNGATIHDLAPEAFATVREASSRVLGLRHFDVQLLGGLVLLHGNVSEMKTGEGKTIVASLPSYLVALEGKGVHVITVNDYLAKRDRELIGQIHEFLGISIGLNIAGMNNTQKKEAYQCDITYGVGTEFGFDYLRDNMVASIEQKVQRPYHYAIIDEVDSILIDEAKTPLIIAGKDQPSGRLYKVCTSVIRSLKEEQDYTFDPEMKVVNFTDDGITKCEKAFGIQNLFDLEHSTLFHSLLQSLRANVLFERDVDYIVDEGAIKLIDLNTGRIMEGRSLSDGLHQAIESKEGLENSEENKTHASITIQNYFRMYQALSGMTGTAKTEEEEIREVYGMDVVVIPSNKPDQRADMQEAVFMTKGQKHAYLLNEIKQRHQKGQPILIGTNSISQSEVIADLMDKEGLHYQLLNAKSVQKEAQMIALAGQKGQITIATNMAGRGTDIMLGDGIAEIGGLHVIGTERNESQRIDNQLKGRSGRQGDSGSTQFIISLEDHLFTRYAAQELERLTPKLKPEPSGLITTKNVHAYVDTAQKIAEGIQFQFREYNLKLESVLNQQREVIYEFRDNILEAEDLLAFITKQTENLPIDILHMYVHEDDIIENMDLTELETELNNTLLHPVSLQDGQQESVEELENVLKQAAKDSAETLLTYKTDEDIVKMAKGFALQVIDQQWMAHLDTMHQLKEGIGMRQYQQEDPVDLFEKEGYTLFENLFHDMKYSILLHLVRYIKKTKAEKVEF